MSIFSFFLLRIAFICIVTKFIVEETWIFIRTTCTVSLYILFCYYQCQPHPSIQYSLFNFLHYDDMNIIAVIYSTIAVLFFILFDNRASEYRKNLRFHRHLPPPWLQHLFLSPVHYILYIFLHQVKNYHHRNHFGHHPYQIISYSPRSRPDFIVILSTLLRH